MQFHGSDVEKVTSIYGSKYNFTKDDLINYSGNMNPLGLSASVVSELKNHIDLIASYPDRDYQDLKKVISNYTDVHPNQIIVGNGSTELISLFIKVIHPSRATIIGPTYSEYEREIKLDGGTCIYHPLKESNDFQVIADDLIKDLNESTDLLVLCNPNNPTSGAIKRDTLRPILDYCIAHNIYVLIDETYVEFVDDVSLVSATDLTITYPNLFIIRGVSKFYAAPGLRLGYGITGSKDILRKINSLKNPWTINSLAAYAGELMLQDKDYIKASRQLILEEKAFIEGTISTWSKARLFPAAANFYLTKITDENIHASDVFEAMIQDKMLIRDASGFPFLNRQYFRFCINTKENNKKLLDALEKILK